MPPAHTGTGKWSDAGESWVDAVVASQLLEGLGWAWSLVWKRGVEGRGGMVVMRDSTGHLPNTCSMPGTGATGSEQYWMFVSQQPRLVGETHKEIVS